MNTTSRLTLLCAGRAGSCMGTMVFAGALPVLQPAWQMNAATAGTIQTAFNLSNALALLVAAWASDSLGARRVYLLCSWAGALALVCFAALARSPHSALVLMVLVGLTQGGAYAPALLLATEMSAPARRGRAIGQMLAAGSLGYLLSVFFTFWVAHSHGITAGFAVCAAGVAAGAALGHYSLRGGASDRPPATTAAPIAVTSAAAGPGSERAAAPFSWRALIRPAALCLLIAYVAHCWELLGNWAWTPSLLAEVLRPLQLNAAVTALLVAAVIHLSGMLSTMLIGACSDYWGRSRVLIVVGALGACCSLLMGWSPHWGPLWAVLIAAVGSFFILGDSGVLSAAMTDAVPPRYLGRAMGVRSVLGFGAGALAPAAFGAALDASQQWLWAYAVLALGGAGACAAALWLHRLKIVDNGGSSST